MKRNMIFFICFLAAAAFADEPKAQVSAITVVEQGIYKCEVLKLVEDLRVPSKQRAIIDSAKIVQETTCIPAVLGTRFGFRYKVDGVPSGRKIDLVMVGIYPNDGVKDPTRDKPLKTFRYTTPYAIGEGYRYTDYSFDHEWEIVPGEWIFQIWYDGKNYAEAKFVVMKPGTE